MSDQDFTPEKRPDKWPTPWIRALLPLAILSCLDEKPAHGYGIATQLERKGFGKPKGGALYPHLVALEEGGHVTADWQPGQGGPGRKEYQITEHGRQRLIAESSWLKELAHSMTQSERADET